MGTVELDPSAVALRPEGGAQLIGHPDPEIVVVGQSHTVCMHDALQDLPDSHRIGTIQPFSSEDYWDIVAQVAPRRHVAIVWQGNQHNSAFLVRPEPMFRIFTSEPSLVPESDSGDQWVSVQRVKAFFDPSFRLLDRQIQRLSGATAITITGTPPPKTEEMIRLGIGREPGLGGVVGRHGFTRENVPISPLSLRVALWRILQEMLRERAERYGATFVPVPREVVDRRGALLESFSYPDGSHANRAYGVLMWQHLLGDGRNRCG